MCICLNLPSGIRLNLTYKICLSLKYCICQNLPNRISLNLTYKICLNFTYDIYLNHTSSGVLTMFTERWQLKRESIPHMSQTQNPIHKLFIKL